MEFLLSLPTPTIATKIFAVLLLYACLRIFTNVLLPKKSKTSPPQVSGAWPLIGHLHLFQGSQPAYITLSKMADKYGPIFKIKIGVRPTIVICNSKIAKECLTTHDKALAGRPVTVAMEIMGYNHSMLGLSSYGPYWRYIRKLATAQLLSSKRLETFKPIKESEVKNSMKEMYQTWVHNKSGSGDSNHVLVDMTRILGDIVSNVTSRIMIGKVYASKNGEDVRWKQVLLEYIELLSNFYVGDTLPFLRWLDLGGLEKTMKKTAKELDNYFEECLEEHMKKRSSSGGDHGIKEEDFMDVMLSIFDDDNQQEIFAHHSPRTINKATCLGLILGSTDTTRSTLIWSLSLLLNHPEVLKKVQQELDVHLGPETPVNESNVKSFVYLEAVIKETLRLYPPGPLGLPHESMEDCTIAGYHVPAGTQVLFHQWKIHQDPNVWENPWEFKPERFLTTHKNVDVRGRNYELLPFGSGRRICPGISFALQVMMLTLANMLHGFDFATLNDEPVDMTEVNGMATSRATPLVALITPRLPPHLYMG